MYWLVYKVITEWWMDAKTLSYSWGGLSWDSRGIKCVCRMRLSHPCPSYGQCSCWPWLSNAVTLGWECPLFLSGLERKVSLCFWDAWILPNWGAFSSSTPDQWKQNPFLRTCLPLSFPQDCRMQYTAPKCISNRVWVPPAELWAPSALPEEACCTVPCLHWVATVVFSERLGRDLFLHFKCCFFYAATKLGFQTWAWLGFNGFSTQHGHWAPPVYFWSDFAARGYKVLKW